MTLEKLTDVMATLAALSALFEWQGEDTERDVCRTFLLRPPYCSRVLWCVDLAKSVHTTVVTIYSDTPFGALVAAAAEVKSNPELL
jgi:hypothetical protein